MRSLKTKPTHVLLTSNILKTERHRKVKKMGKGLPGENKQKAKAGSINPRTMKASACSSHINQGAALRRRSHYFS